ncbi:Tryptophan synthase alpha chain [Alkalibacterium sp. AK22]|uniref:tryptophan synthase subunit alpha n=1 Tax=Alkalibacterium sp. AK22 TaxID=1229520 RepID=UPI000448279D|nr:tryptophan synthase subunit alpha [Alkalibacterium sp. AK22]EXJ23948.1 Tryptophan synthase alpha chain [Alkalibacterium sp. AK22]
MGKEKLDQRFQETLNKGDKLFVPYIMAGDGGLDVLNERIQFLEAAGATALELGIPFSDPVADGPTIQAAGLRALGEKVTLRGVMKKLEETKADRSIPIILMTYMNPIFAYGIKAFARDSAKAGVDGLIIPDLPMEEESRLTGDLTQNNVALIRLAALTSPKERLEKIAQKTEGFLYAVTVKGTTGAQTTFAETVGEYIQELKKMTDTPVLAGFGVSTPDHVRQLSEYGDGVVVGSQIVNCFHDNDRETIQKLIQASKKQAAH